MTYDRFSVALNYSNKNLFRWNNHKLHKSHKFNKRHFVYQDHEGGADVSSDDSDDDANDVIDLDRERVSKEMSDYFGDMKNELRGTNVSEDRGVNPDGDDQDWDRPLDVDSQLLKNLLESYQGQDGAGGPTSTLLEPLGIKLNKKGNPWITNTIYWRVFKKIRKDELKVLKQFCEDLVKLKMWILKRQKKLCFFLQTCFAVIFNGNESSAKLLIKKMWKSQLIKILKVIRNNDLDWWKLNEKQL